MRRLRFTLPNSLRHACILACLMLAALHTPAALALPEDKLIGKLNSIPVFTVVDAKGSPLLLKTKDKTEAALLNFYLDASLAQQAMQAIRKQDAKVAQGYKVSLTGLGQAYRVAKEQRQKKDNKVQFQFLSSPQSVQTAFDIAKKQNPQLKNFPSVPIFFLAGGPKKGILTLNRDGKEYLPMFLSKDDLDRNLRELKQTKPDMAKQLSVEVATLDSVVGTILDTKNDDESSKITFIPAQKALEYAQTLQKSVNKPKS
ncbi:MAG: hypothetical protein H7Y22_07470 [Gemmatimonadaceae bacterium]|nr:hypothetical protein [Gloeobacterales cyanobacterium ES-bin-141]